MFRHDDPVWIDYWAHIRPHLKENSVSKQGKYEDAKKPKTLILRCVFDDFSTCGHLEAFLFTSWRHVHSYLESSGDDNRM